MPRDYKDKGIEELERPVHSNANEPLVLRDILEELQHRRVPRAKQLRNEIRGYLEGEIDGPDEEPPADSAEKQMDLLE